MGPITFDAFLAGSGLSMDGLKNRRRRGELVTAFGRDVAYRSLGYIEADCVGPVLVDVLGSGRLGARRAARILRINFDIWAKTLSIADVGRPSFLAYVEQRNRFGGELTFAMGTATDDPAIIKRIADEWTGEWTEHTYAVDMAGVLKTVRANAKRGGYDFSARFLPPPDSAELAELLAPFVAARDEAARAIREGKADEDIEGRMRRAGILARALVEARPPEGGKAS
jgi:hypothetical protein